MKRTIVFLLSNLIIIFTLFSNIEVPGSCYILEQATPSPTITDEPKSSPAPSKYQNIIDGFALKTELNDANVVFVTIQNEFDIGCSFYAFEKNILGWTFLFETKGYLGKNGIALSGKMEGDGKTPSGIYHMGVCFGIESEPSGMKVPYTVLSNDDYWDSNVSSPTYNTWIKDSETKVDLSNTSLYEHLISHTPVYNYCALIEYNTNPVVAGGGSGIFLHCTRPLVGKNTLGCVAIPEEFMIKALQVMTENSYIVILKSNMP